MPYPAQIDASKLGERALEVAERKGWDNWGLREVAGELGVTANALYRHVGDRAGLVIAMGEAATRQLHGDVKRSLGRVKADDTDGRVVALARCIARFAKRRPHAYAAFLHGKPTSDHPARATWFSFWGEMKKTIGTAVPESPDAATVTLWAFLVGRIELSNGPVLSRVSFDAGLADAVRALLAGFRANGPIVSPLPKNLSWKTK